MSNDEKDEQKKKSICPLFRCMRRRKQSISVKADIIDISSRERHEYVVEKLAIKRLPLKLIAMDEDLLKESEGGSVLMPTEKTSILGREREKNRSKDNANSAGKTSYNAMESEDVSRPKRDNSLLTRYNKLKELNKDAANETATFPVIVGNESTATKIKEEISTTTDGESEMVCHILDQWSSLGTINSKSAPLPKEPPGYPQKYILPHNLQKHYNYSQYAPAQRVVKAYVHQEALPIIHSSLTSSLKELPPDLQQTITALGVAQKPRTPGFPPRNIRHLKNAPTVEEEEEECAYNVLKVGSDHQLTLKSAPVLNASSPPSSPTSPNRPPLPGDKISLFESVPESQVLPRTHVAQTFKTEVSDPCPSVFYPDSVEKDSVPDTGGETTSADSHQITEISQLKGQSLKWKIIIKHHTDKPKKEAETTNDENSEELLTAN